MAKLQNICKRCSNCLTFRPKSLEQLEDLAFKNSCQISTALFNRVEAGHRPQVYRCKLGKWGYAAWLYNKVETCDGFDDSRG